MTPPEPDPAVPAPTIRTAARTAADPCDDTHPAPACPSDQCHLKTEPAGARSVRRRSRRLPQVIDTGPAQPLIVNTGAAQPLIIDRPPLPADVLALPSDGTELATEELGEPIATVIAAEPPAIDFAAMVGTAATDVTPGPAVAVSPGSPVPRSEPPEAGGPRWADPSLSSEQVRDAIIAEVGMMGDARTPAMQVAYDAAVARETPVAEPSATVAIAREADGGGRIEVTGASSEQAADLGEALLDAGGFIEVAPGLYVGGPVESAAPYAGIGMIILAATELQPELPAFKGTIVRAALTDTLRPTKQELENAAIGATLAYDTLVRGGAVIVSCSDGRQRAALIAGLVLGKRLPATEVVILLRRALGERALANATFHKIVWQTAGATPRAAAPPATASQGAAVSPARGRGSYGPRPPRPGKPAAAAGKGASS